MRDGHIMELLLTLVYFYMAQRSMGQNQLSGDLVSTSILKISCFCTDGKISVRINLPLLSTVVPAIIFVFLACRPFVAITTLSTGLVGVEVTTSTGQKHKYNSWDDGGK